MPQAQIFDATVSLVPKTFTLENLKFVFKIMKFPESFLNSVILSTIVMSLQMISSLLIGYGFGRFAFPFKKLLFAIGIFTLLVPPQILIYPLYLDYSNFDIFGIIKLITGDDVNLLNTYLPFVFSSALGVGSQGMIFIFMFRQYFKGVPKELEEAARVDGSNEFYTFVRIMIPAATPVIVCVAVLAFVWQWNDYFYTSNYLSGVELLSVNLYSLSDNVTASLGQGSVNNAYISILNSCGTLMVLAPLIVAYLFVQKGFIQSVERSGIVG